MGQFTLAVVGKCRYLERERNYQSSNPYAIVVMVLNSSICKYLLITESGNA
jgi:hypothetical protein